MKATSPEGVPIVGIIGVVPCTSAVDPDSFRRDDKGEIDFEENGKAEVDWNLKEPSLWHGRRQFIDDAGILWNEDQIVLVPDSAGTEDVSAPIAA